MKNLCFVLLTFAAFCVASADEEKLYVKPNSAKGYVEVVNQQTRIPESEFVKAVGYLRPMVRISFKFVPKATGSKDALTVLSLVDVTNRPPMTVSPEAGIGELNVAALAEGLKTETSVKKFLAPRARREFARLVAFVFCAGGSQFSGNLMSAQTVRDLDYLGDRLPADTLARIIDNSAKRGFVPEYAVDYETACQEGWAPEPKTDEEKKIWKEVRAIPTEPIKVKFDPKKGE